MYMTFLILSYRTIQYKMMLIGIIQPIQIITNSSQNTIINNLSRKFRLYLCVCVFVCLCLCARARVFAPVSVYECF